MKQIIFIILLAFSFTSMNAQSFEEEYIVNSGKDNNTIEEESRGVEKNLNYNFNIGTAFTAWKSGSMLSTYINPNLNYRFTPRFSVSTGIIISNNSLFSQNYNLNGENSNFTNAYLHLTGIYQVNEKLQVTGSVLYKKNNFTNEMNPNAFNNLDYSVGAKYKVTKNIELGVQFSKRSYSPFMPVNSFRTNDQDEF